MNSVQKYVVILTWLAMERRGGEHPKRHNSYGFQLLDRRQWQAIGIFIDLNQCISGSTFVQEFTASLIAESLLRPLSYFFLTTFLVCGSQIAWEFPHEGGRRGVGAPRQPDPKHRSCDPMSQANHEPNHNSPQTERRVMAFPRRHLQRPDAPIVSNPEAHLLPKVAAAGGGDDDGRDGRKRRRLRCVRNAPLPSAQPIYIIYQIRRLSDERSYVGVTQRGLETRFRFHRYDAQRRGKRLRAGGLAEAIRQTIERNVAIHEEFEITKIDGCSTPREARKLEQHWIERLQTRAPSGFNLQPGGASLGGPANGKPITLRIDGQRARRFPSIMSALNYVNALRIRDGKSPLGFPTVRARIEAGHTPRQAFEFEERVDRRQLRATPIHVAGKEFFSLANAAKESGLSQSALKGRRWRASRAGLGSASLAEDRRLPGTVRYNGAKTGRLPPFELPHPHNANEVVSAADFARLTGLPKATITYRYQKILHEEGDQLFSLDREEIIARLLEGPERRIQISLPVPDGRVLHGGVRELIRKVLADPDLRAMRSEDIGLSGIRKRLRETESWPTPPTPQIVAKAIGFGDADI